MKVGISPEQKEQFHQNGFLLIKVAIPHELLTQWQNLADDLETSAKDAGSDLADACVVEAEGSQLILRQNQLLNKDKDAVFRLLGLPDMLAIARDLCGVGTIPLSCDLHYKRSGKNSTVLWHQDTLHSRNFSYINIGMYLDDSDQGDGCLRYVSGSQNKPQDICRMVKQYGWDIPGAIDCPAKAGDILVHDIMVLHGSKIKTSNNVRRTVYVEMRQAQAILEEGRHSTQWLELRKKWMSMILNRVPSEEEYDELCEGLPDHIKNESEVVKELYNLREPVAPASYCHKPIINKHYPFK